MNLDEIGPAVDSAAIEKLEELCGHKLPPDYVKFLKKSNGGKLEGYQYVAVPGGDTVAVDALAGLGKGALHDTFEWFSSMNMGEEDVPPGYVPVAFTPGGDPFVISMVDEVQGVYFWDEPQFFKKSRKKSHAYFVAPTFSKFLKLLRPTLEEAEADLAKSDSSIKPVGLVKPKKVKVIRPKFKGDLDTKLDQACKHFPALFRSGKCSDSMSSSKAGYELTVGVEHWSSEDSDVINECVNDLKDHADLAALCKKQASAFMLYPFLWGFVLGQLQADRIPMKTFVYAEQNIVAAVLRNQGLVPA